MELQLTPELRAWGATADAVVERFSSVWFSVYPLDDILNPDEAPFWVLFAVNGASPFAALLAAHSEPAKVPYPGGAMNRFPGSLRWLLGCSDARAVSRVAAWNWWLRWMALFQHRGSTQRRSP